PPSFTVDSGNWIDDPGNAPISFNTTQMQYFAPPTDPAASVTWTFTGLDVGAIYDVAATWQNLFTPPGVTPPGETRSARKATSAPTATIRAQAWA
ncbi:MAG: hypothetical protein ACR2NU_12220, partial [Aeoliella sp.]